MGAGCGFRSPQLLVGGLGCSVRGLLWAQEQTTGRGVAAGAAESSAVLFYVNRDGASIVAAVASNRKSTFHRGRTRKV